MSESAHEDMLDEKRIEHAEKGRSSRATSNVKTPMIHELLARSAVRASDFRPQPTDCPLEDFRRYPAAKERGERERERERENAIKKRFNKKCNSNQIKLMTLDCLCVDSLFVTNRR
jgi:hypothetical protein